MHHCARYKLRGTWNDGIQYGTLNHEGSRAACHPQHFRYIFIFTVCDLMSLIIHMGLLWKWRKVGFMTGNGYRIVGGVGPFMG